MTATLAPKLCECDGCGRPATGLGLCKSHWMRYRAHGASFDPSPIGSLHGKKNSGPCSVDGCGWEARTGGLCTAHYERRRSTGDIRPNDPVIDTDFDPIGFCACPSPQPEQVRLWGTVLIDAYQCATCRRGIRSTS